MELLVVEVSPRPPQLGTFDLFISSPLSQIALSRSASIQSARQHQRALSGKDAHIAYTVVGIGGSHPLKRSSVGRCVLWLL